MNRSEVNFELFLNEFPSIVLVIDESFNIKFFNLKARSSFEDVSNLLEVFSEKELASLSNKKASQVILGSRIQDKVYSASFKRIDDLILLELKDVTLVSKLEKSVESQRALQNRLMVSSERLKIISSVAHEINNPLMILQGNFDMLINALRTGYDQSRIDELINSSKKSITRIFKVLNEKSVLNRLESFENIENVNIYQYCTELFDLYRDKLRIESIDVKLDMSLNKDFLIRKSLLKFVLVELIDNAIFFIQEDDTNHRYIKLVLSKEVGFINIEFKNSGKPIVLDNHSQIFEPFFTTKKSSDGTGVGLYHAKEALNKYGSDIYYMQESDVAFNIRLKLEKS